MTQNSHTQRFDEKKINAKLRQMRHRGSKTTPFALYTLPYSQQLSVQRIHSIAMTTGKATKSFLSLTSSISKNTEICNRGKKYILSVVNDCVQFSALHLYQVAEKLNSAYKATLQITWVL